jgi:phage baseplate assembly protein W
MVAVLVVTDIPHFSLPFRFVGGRAAVNEQDSPDDVADCMLAIASYPIGTRVEKPTFGIPDDTFRQKGIDPAALAAAINAWEKRALTDATLDNSDLVDRVSRATVAPKETPA